MVEPREPVRGVMSVGALSVGEKLTLRSLAAVLAGADVGVALVEMPGGAAGIVSERDLVRALADGADADEVWAADVMVEDLVIAEPDEPIVDVARRMVDEKVRHVAIVDRGTIIGVVSVRDVLAVLVDHATQTI